MFYLWLCVVSHFQILREVSALGLSDLEHVKPFKNEPDTESVMYTEEYPTSYDKDKEDVIDEDDLNHEYDPVKEHNNSRPNSANVVEPAPVAAEYNAPPEVDLPNNL